MEQLYRSLHFSPPSSTQCKCSCVFGELQTREVEVSVPESLLKNVICRHERTVITRHQYGSLRTSHTDQINITGICNKVMKGRSEDEARDVLCLHFKSHSNLFLNFILRIRWQKPSIKISQNSLVK